MAAHYPVGKYLCRGVGQGFGETSKGNPQFVLQFTVLSAVCDDGTVVEEDQQYNRSAYLVINNNTFKFQIEGLRAIGWTGDSFANLDPKTPGFFDFADREFEMWCAHDVYNRKESEKWTPATGGGEFVIQKPIDAKGLRSLDNLFGKELKATASKRPAASMPPPPPADFGGLTDEDVAF